MVPAKTLPRKAAIHSPQMSTLAAVWWCSATNMNGVIDPAITR